MKHVVMGTAGHVDHGKTTLVKRLTGVDTDRLEEEKRRGMTIELGFAPLTLPSGNVISIIDVPGHERFIKTMVAGVTGIDFVMLTVAADEGVMPQTREHIEILSLLEVRSGVVALTKADLADPQWLQLVKEDIRLALADTSLKDLQIVEVSALTGTGIDRLLEILERLAFEAADKSAGNLFRLSVDRVFTMAGHGTVVTGTVSGGSIMKGDSVEVLPKGLMAKVRGIQVHSRKVEAAASGDRCALNLSGADKSDIERGDVISLPGLIEPVMLADAVLYTTREKGGVKHNQRVHVNTGTKELLARISVLEKEEIISGDKGYVQLKFEEPAVIIRGDRFIIRSYSPVDTIGGGFILFHNTNKRQRFSKEAAAVLEKAETGALPELAEYLLSNSEGMVSEDELWKQLYCERNELREILGKYSADNRIILLEETGKYLSKALYNEYIKEMENEFEKLRIKYPFRYQIDREEIKSKLFIGVDSKDFSALLNKLKIEGYFELDGNNITRRNNDISRIFEMKETKNLEKAILEDGLNLRNLQQLGSDFRLEESQVAEIMRFLLQLGRIRELGNNVFLHQEVLKAAVSNVKAVMDADGSAATPQIRDALGCSRKTAIALLEYLDNIQVTMRVGDLRKPGANYMDYFERR